MSAAAAAGPSPATPTVALEASPAIAHREEPKEPAVVARVRLVEDDASIRRFVTLALEELPVQLVTCNSLAAARQALRTGPWVLVLLDLMLPDGHGTELLQDAAARQAAGHAAWVAFSAGVNEVMRERLQELGVAQLLRKPVPLSALQACVMQALDGAPVARHQATPADTRLTAVSSVQQPLPADGSVQAEAAAIDAYYEGDAALFAQMKTGVGDRFRQDCEAGDQALAQGDAAALRRVAHSLKSALRLLGRPRAAELAATLEEAARVGERSLWPTLWRALRGCLMAGA